MGRARMGALGRRRGGGGRTRITHISHVDPSGAVPKGLYDKIARRWVRSEVSAETVKRCHVRARRSVAGRP